MRPSNDDNNLDYGESYGKSNVGEDESKVPTLSDGRSNHSTGFDPSDVDDHEMVERDGQWMPKWQWLNQLNSGRHNRNGTNVQDANVERDVDVLCSDLDLPNSVKRRTMEIIMDVRDNREAGLSFGDLPVEVAEIGAVTLACRKIVDSLNFDTLDELDPDSNKIHEVALGEFYELEEDDTDFVDDSFTREDDTAETFLDKFVPDPKEGDDRREMTPKDVKKVRRKLAEYTDV